MMSAFRRWVRRQSRPKVTPSTKCRWQLAVLEERTVPATITQPYVAIGSQVNGIATVRVYNPSTNALVAQLQPFGAFKGTVNVAVGDVNGDGIQDIVCGSGAGADPVVVVYDGSTITSTTPRRLASFYPYANSSSPAAGGVIFHGGVNVAVGDVNGDGDDDIITGPGFDPKASAYYIGTSSPLAASMKVRVFDGANLNLINPTDYTSTTGQLYGFAPGFGAPVGQIFAGGISVASADLGGDGKTAEVVTGVESNGSSHVIVYATPIAGDPTPTAAAPMTLLGQFFAFPTSYQGGVDVAAGALTNNVDTNGFHYADIITSKRQGPVAVNIFRLLDATNPVTNGDGSVTPANYIWTADLSTAAGHPLITPNISLAKVFGASYGTSGAVNTGGATVGTFLIPSSTNEFGTVALIVGVGPYTGTLGRVVTYSNISMNDGDSQSSLPSYALFPSFTAFGTAGIGVSVS